jgi:hypothetical protein
MCVSFNVTGMWDSLADVATRYELDDRGIAVRVTVGSRNGSYGSPSADPYAVDSGDSSKGAKAAG